MALICPLLRPISAYGVGHFVLKCASMSAGVYLLRAHARDGPGRLALQLSGLGLMVSLYPFWRRSKNICSRIVASLWTCRRLRTGWRWPPITLNTVAQVQLSLKDDADGLALTVCARPINSNNGTIARYDTKRLLEFLRLSRIGHRALTGRQTPNRPSSLARINRRLPSTDSAEPQG
jgi:hypothetical protein